MKKIPACLLGGLLILFFSSSLFSGIITVTSAKSGTVEYFGGPRTIDIGGIGYRLGIDYANGDVLQFWLPTTDFQWRNDPNEYYMLVNTGPGAGETWTYDTDGDSVADFADTAVGGYKAQYIEFRLISGSTRYWRRDTTWYLSSVPVTKNPDLGTMMVRVPDADDLSRPSGSKSKKYYLDTTTKQNSTTLDPAEEVIFFTLWNEYYFDKTDEDTVIDVIYERKLFADEDDYSLIDDGEVGQYTTGNTANYKTGTALDSNTKYWRFTVGGSEGDMEGITKVTVEDWAEAVLNSNTPVAGEDETVIDIIADYINPQTGKDEAALRIEVSGDDVLDDRNLKLVVDWLGSATQDFYPRTLATNKDAWSWTTNGTIFRSIMFVTAYDSNYITTFRIANESSVPNAKIWARVWLDSAPDVEVTGEIGTVPKGSKLSFNAYDMCVALGIDAAKTYQEHLAGKPWAGRVEFTVWSPPRSTWGACFYRYGDNGYSIIPLEKKVSFEDDWWEK